MASVAAETADSDERQFHTGQPVWVFEPDGSERPGEYLGEGQEARSLPGPPKALIIFVDVPGVVSKSSVCGCEHARKEAHVSPCRRVRQPRHELRRREPALTAVRPDFSLAAPAAVNAEFLLSPIRAVTGVGTEAEYVR